MKISNPNTVIKIKKTENKINENSVLIKSKNLFFTFFVISVSMMLSIG